ncbi:hypothetical protein D081_1596 [Anaerovibrio sp. JC8]|nr:hypothetical protein D081_1596 [Anaerovibrio sp. JC8]
MHIKVFKIRYFYSFKIWGSKGGKVFNGNNLVINLKYYRLYQNFLLQID